MPAQPFPAQFKRETHTINGVKTVVLTAGKAEPLVFPARRRYLARLQFRAAVGGEIPRHRSVPSGLRRIRRRSGDERHA